MDRSHLMQVADIERACFSHPWSLELLEQELYNDMLSLIVAEGEDGTVLGYGEVRAILDEGTLEKIAVAPAYRRQGVAEAILSAFLRFGQAHLAFLTLEVRDGIAHHTGQEKAFTLEGQPPEELLPAAS